MGSDDRDSAVYAPFDAIKRHYGYLHRIEDIGEALQLAPKVNTTAAGMAAPLLLEIEKLAEAQTGDETLLGLSHEPVDLLDAGVSEVHDGAERACSSW